MKMDTIFENAFFYAGRRHYWRERANGPEQDLTRRQCLGRARRAENRIIDLAIRAEKLARRAAGGAA